MTRLLATRVLAHSGYRVEARGSGPSGWEAFCAMEFDVVVSDLALPGFDGIELLRRVLDCPKGRTTRTIAWSTNPELLSEARDLGCDRLLDKRVWGPLTLPDVVELLARVTTATSNQ